jgi:hypothetical protein
LGTHLFEPEVMKFGWLLFVLVGLMACSERKRPTFTNWLRKIYAREQDSVEPIEKNKSNKRHFLKCPKELHDLVERYFAPHRNGIYREMISDAAFPTDDVLKPQGLVLVQVLNNTIYVDKSMFSYFESFDGARMNFLLDRLYAFIVQRSTRYPGSTERNKDFEFVFVRLMLY